ncbi:MAG: hypothetical protein VYA30_13890 [Myxococcota bacterium]|nr:hypothetical protein [Myxococcota bacterium]
MNAFVRVTLLIGLCLVQVACQSKDQGAPPKVVPKMPAAQVPIWTTLFSNEPAQSPKLLGPLGLGDSEAKIKAISPELLSAKGLSTKAYGQASVRVLLHSDSRLVRSIKVGLPLDALSQLTKLWGVPREASINGQSDGWFWFDEDKKIQVIFEHDTKGSTLVYWPYMSLADLFEPHVFRNRSPVAMLGRKSAEVRAIYPRQMERRARPGFVTWLPPLKFWTRPLSLRIAEADGRVIEVEWKLDINTDTSIETRVNDILAKKWTKKNTRDGRQFWRSGNIDLSIAKQKAGKFRPNEFILLVQAQVSSGTLGPTPSQ